MKLYRILLLTLCVYALISCGGAEERKAVYLEKAEASLASGDLEKARIELKNVLQIDPKDGEAYYQLGKIFEQKKEYRKAYGNYIKAEELKPDLLENHARLGRFYLLLMNDTDKAQEKIDLILSKEPNNSDGLLLKAAVLLRNKKPDEAITIAKNIVVQDSNHIDSVTFLVALYVQDKKLNDAINVLDAALKNNKNNQKLNKLLASVLVANKDYERAEILYKSFLEKNPNSSSSYNNLAAFYNQMDDKTKAEKILRASIDNDLGDEDRILTLIKYVRATESDNEAIKELESFITANDRLGKLRIALAEILIMSGDSQAAIKVFKEAINDFSEEVTGITARTALASIYIRDKNYDKAAAIVEEAILISPNDPQVNYLRAKFAVRNNDFEKAIISLRIVTKEMPENIEAYFLLANVYQLEGNEGQVKSTLNSAYKNNRTNSDGLLKLASFYINKDVNQAEKIIDDFNSLKESDYNGLSIKAAILNQKKLHNDAKKIAEKLMELYPNKPNGYLQAIPFYAQSNEKQKAISLLESGYINVKENRKLLTILTTLQVAEKQFKVAIKRIKAELNTTPEDAEMKILLSKVYLASEDSKTAVSLLTEVVSAQPTKEEPYLLLEQIYRSQKDLRSAKSILEKGNRNLVSSLKIAFRLATVYELDNDYKKSIVIYRNLFEENQSNLIIINNLASLLSDHGDKEEDLKLAKKLVEKLKESGAPVYLDTIGWVYYKVGDYQKAIEYLKQVVEKAPEISIFNYHLGMAYKMAGDNAQAKVFLEKSLTNENFSQRNLAESALKDI